MVHGPNVVEVSLNVIRVYPDFVYAGELTCYILEMKATVVPKPAGRKHF